MSESVDAAKTMLFATEGPTVTLASAIELVISGLDALASQLEFRSSGLTSVLGYEIRWLWNVAREDTADERRLSNVQMYLRLVHAKWLAHEEFARYVHVLGHIMDVCERGLKANKD